MQKLVRKPIKWVASAKRDLDAMPEDVKDVVGHAIDLAQAGGKHVTHRKERCHDASQKDHD